jgi:hypothetical protein
MGMLIIQLGVNNFFFFAFLAFYGNNIRCSGNVTYVNQATATTDQLTYVNAAGNAIIKVDNTTTILPAPLVNRNSASCYMSLLYNHALIFPP